ncbi:MAG TPA: hypothetical protein VLM42_14680, partial [Bryobacteraceae bacterium]|nr:hypothetical protein [Bryobacteraceae bacterium]
MADSQKIDIVAVDGKGALKEFIEFPFGLYRGNPNWVAPLRIAVKDLLDRKKHPFYKNADAEFFLARRGGKTVGRVAAIVDRNHNKFHGENAGFFGFFECVDDLAVAQGLLQKAREWTAERGAEFLRGPVNPSTNYECGILVDGFDSDPKVMMTYNPTYYPALLEQAGLRKAKDLYAYGGLAPQVDVRKIERVANKAMAKHDFRIRPIDVKNFDAEVMRVWEIYNSAWSVNWGFIPMSREEFVLMGKEMKQI